MPSKKRVEVSFVTPRMEKWEKVEDFFVFAHVKCHMLCVTWASFHRCLRKICKIKPFFEEV